jgi:protease I
MADELKGKRFAMVATDGFEQSELTEPRGALKRAGAVVDIVAPKFGRIQGMQHHEKGAAVCRSITRSMRWCPMSMQVSSCPAA